MNRLGNKYFRLLSVGSEREVEGHRLEGQLRRPRGS
jgi:hypothetical protein